MSIGFKKLKTAIFISGTGSNFKSIYKFSLTSPILFVVADITLSEKNNIIKEHLKGISNLFMAIFT